jgi:hypothetical protein
VFGLADEYLRACKLYFMAPPPRQYPFTQYSRSIVSLMREGRHCNLFRMGSETWSPEIVEFCRVFEGKARLPKSGGLDFWRVDVG